MPLAPLSSTQAKRPPSANPVLLAVLESVSFRIWCNSRSSWTSSIGRGLASSLLDGSRREVGHSSWGSPSLQDLLAGPSWVSYRYSWHCPWGLWTFSAELLLDFWLLRPAQPLAFHVGVGLGGCCALFHLLGGVDLSLASFHTNRQVCRTASGLCSIDTTSWVVSLSEVFHWAGCLGESTTPILPQE